MIKRIRVQKFKSFKDVSATLGLRTVLVGPNMSGKSNFIEVFRFLQRMSFPREPGLWGLANAFVGGVSESTWKGGDSNLIVIGLEGERGQDAHRPNAQWLYEIAIVGDVDGSVRAQQETLTVSREGQTYELIDAANGRRSLKNEDGRLIMENIDANRSALEFEVPGWDGSFLRSMIASWRFYQLVPALVRRINQATAQRSLSETGDNLSSWLMSLQTRHGEAFALIKQVCRDVFPELQDIFTEPTQHATVTVASKEKFLRRAVPIWQMSDGELMFIGLLSLIFSPPELRASLYCVEEPENHLHPRLLDTFVELLKQVQAEFAPEDASQIIFTTHSPHLVDKFALDELIVLEKSQGASVLTFPKDRAHLRELLKGEELGLGDLAFSGVLAGA